MTTPAWLQAHLETIGQANNDDTTLRPRTDHCRCGTPVIRALDADVAGYPRTLDARPLTTLGETTTLLTGGRTATLRRLAPGLRLYARSHWDIGNHPPDAPGRDYDVLADHRCHHDIPNQLTCPPATTKPPTQSGATDDIPF